MQKLLCTIYLLTWSLGCLAQSRHDNYELIDRKRGLSHNIVLSLLQDKDGLLWIGTYNGLCLYDGTKFTKIDCLPSDSNNVFSQPVEAIYEDHNSNIWIGTRYGFVGMYSKKDKQFKNYYSGLQSRINIFFQDSNNRLWFSNVNGTIGEIKDKKLHHYPMGMIWKIFAITEKNADTLLLLSNYTLYAYSKKQHQIIPVPDILFDGYNWTVAAISAGSDIYAINQTGCYKINREGHITRNIIKQLPYFKTNRHQKLAVNDKGNIYYTDGIVIAEYEKNGHPVNKFRISEHRQEVLEGETINAIHIDRSGIIWIGTNGGLYKIDKHKYQFDKYTQNSYLKKITQNYVRSVYIDRYDNLWVGTYGGEINRLVYDKKNSHYTFRESYQALASGRYISEYITNCFLQLRNGTLLAGGQHGLTFFDKEQCCFNNYLPAHISNRVSEIWCLHEDKNGKVWIGTNGMGLFIYDPVTKKIYNYIRDNTHANTIAGSSVWNIYGSSDGTIWLGTNNGLCRARNDYDPELIQFENIPLNSATPVQVWSFAEDGNGDLWLGTTGQGIFSVDRKKDKVTHFNNLGNNTISSIFFDRNNTLWFSSVNGLYHYDKQMKFLASFDEQDGLLSADFNFKAFAAANDGTVYLGTKSGIVSFLPEGIIPENYSEVPVLFTSLKVMGHDSSYALFRSEQIKLKFDQNNINISFAIPEYSRPETHTYRYKLDGLEKEWTYTSVGQPNASYSNVAPGSYKFVVQGSANGNIWSSKVASLYINISPAIWQRTIFWVLIAGTIIMSVVYLVYNRIQVLIKREQHKNRINLEIATLELSALQAQMNPHFIFNTLNSIQHYIIRHDEVAANSYLSKFAKLMRLFLESSKNKYTSLGSEIELINLYTLLEKLRLGDTFEYAIEICNSLNADSIKIPSMLIQPFVENAIQHGLIHQTGNGYLYISFHPSTTGNYVVCKIEDNGVGRKKSAEINAGRNTTHISRGMQLIEERIKTYNFIEARKISIEITDKSIDGTGTIVILTIPVIGNEMNTDE